MVVDPHTRLEGLLNRLEPEFQAGFRRLVSGIRDEGLLSAVEDFISRGQPLAALSAIQQNIAVFADGIVAGFVTAGVSSAEAVGDLIQMPISFNQTNSFAVDFMQENRSRLIREFTQGQERAIRAALIPGIVEGEGPRQQALRIRDAMGLTERQVQTVERYRLLLGNLNREALERGLRDKRFDRTVATAIRNDTPLTAAQINRMTDRYRERLLDFRGRKIAQSEALRAVHAGNHEAYRQIIASGVIQVTDLERVWHTAGDDAVRSSHTSMNGQVRGMEEEFLSGAGAFLLFPGDPNAGAEETAGCRCTVATRINRDLLA